MHYAYLDESGDVTSPLKSGYFLVIAVLTTDQQVARSIHLHIKRMRKRIRKKALNEFKASLASSEQNKRLLRSLSCEDIRVIAIIVDKTDCIQPSNDPEELYRKGVSLAARQCVERWPQLILTVDKRYTKQSLRDKLNATILSEVKGLAYQCLIIEHRDSHAISCLQAADCLAWAIRQKYEADDVSYYDLIKARIVSETVIEVK